MNDVLQPAEFIEPCLPTISRSVPTGRQWAYEIKHDGFRFLCVRQRERVRVYSRGGYDWASQLPAIVAAIQALPVKSATLDGEGVICGPDGKSDFERMRACFSRQGAGGAFLYAFDLLELDGADLRNEPWARRRAVLARLLDDAGPGIRLNEHLEDVDGAVVFRQACVMGLEGIVAKRRDSLDQDQEPGAPGDRARHADRPEQASLVALARAPKRIISGNAVCMNRATRGKTDCVVGKLARKPRSDLLAGFSFA